MQAADGRPPPFSNERHSSRLPSKIQAIVTSYKFTCCGNITEWRTYVEPKGRKHRTGAYDITFQVWRPSPTVIVDGCYSLVGENRFTSIRLGGGGLVSETPETSSVIAVQPGDVMGYYTLSRNDPQNRKTEGIRMVNRFSDSVWYHTGSIDIDRAPNCPYPVGTQSNGVLMSSTNAAPVLSVSLCKFFTAWLCMMSDDNFHFKLYHRV